jgi:hypothetical protein
MSQHMSGSEHLSAALAPTITAEEAVTKNYDAVIDSKWRHKPRPRLRRIGYPRSLQYNPSGDG